MRIRYATSKSSTTRSNCFKIRTKCFFFGCSRCFVLSPRWVVCRLSTSLHFVSVYVGYMGLCFCLCVFVGCVFSFLFCLHMLVVIWAHLCGLRCSSSFCFCFYFSFFSFIHFQFMNLFKFRIFCRCLFFCGNVCVSCMFITKHDRHDLGLIFFCPSCKSTSRNWSWKKIVAVARPPSTCN